MNLLSSADISKEDIEEIFKIADSITSGKQESALKENAIVALFFEEPSTRTMVSFEVAAAQLGGMPIYIDARASQVSRGETLGDTAKVLSSYCDFIAVRINDHEQLQTLAENSKVPVINALTSLEHPTQALADCYTILAARGKSDLKRIRIAFMGDIAQNTANSLMLTSVKIGASVALVGPKGYKPNTYYFNKAREYGEVNVYDSMEEGLEGADVVYTDTFVSMGDEAEAAKRVQMFAPYQLNAKALSYARNDAVVMHPLPAHRGVEIDADVIDGPRSLVWEQAKNKLLIEKAILLYISQKA
ncbi:MAG: ornithine carbamoyltransferase [Candidatus Micrarchaeota archaeon]|nr:ornithine carbamoyltransferase [Candidatus Micrarchaeota archaeon]